MMQDEPMRGRSAAVMIETFEYPEMPWSRERDGLTESELQARFSEMFPGGGVGAPGTGLGPERSGWTPPHGYGSVFDVGDSVLGIVEGERDAEVELRIAAECRSAEERGQSEGLELGRAQTIAQAREEAARQVHGERDRLYAQGRALVESFAETRESYLHELEQESVRLALAIAARVLRREAQMDPLLLTGAVRVALGQLAESTTVRLCVPQQDQALWRESMGLIPGLRIRPQVIGEEQMEPGDCRIETELGSANLGLWAQLKEIERGFFDRVGESISEEPELQADDRRGSRGFTRASAGESGR